MKNARKLIPALAMLLVSAILMTTASFAWFSMNSSVTATGMTVKATAPTSLLISNTSATAGFGSTVALENDQATGTAAAKFLPVTYASGCAGWYQLTDKGTASVNEQGKLPEAVTFGDGTLTGEVILDKKLDGVAVYKDGGSFVYHDTVWLKVDGENDMAVKATVTYIDGTTTDAIKNAMHVVFKVGSNIYDVDMSTGVSGQIAELTHNEAGTQVDIYYFLSGNDNECQNTSIKEDRNMGVTIKFDKYTAS